MTTRDYRESEGSEERVCESCGDYIKPGTRNFDNYLKQQGIEFCSSDCWQSYMEDN